MFNGGAKMKRYLIIAKHNRYGYIKTFNYNDRHEAMEKAISMIIDGFTVKIRDNATGLEDCDI